MKKNVIIISGCCGFMGSYFTRDCLKLGWEILGIDKLTHVSNLDLLEEFKLYSNFKFIQSDINDLKFLYESDYFVNFCAESHVGNSINNSDDFIHTNINGVHHILELIRNSKNESKNFPTFFQISTDEVYSDILIGKHTEKDLLKPSNPYSATKASADMLVLAWARTYNLPYIILRPVNNFGIYQYHEKLIPKTIKYLQLGKKIPLHNNGTPIRNFLHASDTSQAVLKIINSGVKNEIYNVSGNFEQSNINTVTQIIHCYFGDNRDITPYVDFSYSRSGQDLRYALDDSKLRSLGWSPKSNFDEELVQIVEYYKNSKFIW